ncbi:MAG: hypothetical protein M3R58_15070 [Pseudomonadota bacterium]|nr:hypothetical protein [Pseudomonadota bacterium]
MRFKMRLLAATVLTALAPLALAQIPGGEVPPPAANHGQALVAGKIASNFATLAGSPENALALTNALRNGTDVTLTTVVPPPAGSTEPPTTTTTTFTPPTGKMGWGNVKHSLALARDALARAGVTNPTAEQLQTALMGGDIVVTNTDGAATTTPLRGILVMRAEGMGWGNIAKAGGTKLGPVTSKVKMGNTATTTTAAGGTTSATVKSKGITTAAGGSAVQGGGKAKVSGVVTAAGGSAGHAPKGNAYGRGIVTASGGGATNVAAAGGGNAGGNGKGNGKGGGKPGG